MLIASTNLRKQSLHTKAQKDESWKFPCHFIWWYFSSSQVCWSVLQTVGNKCFEKCVTKPGSSLSGSESSCISRCVDRYIEATGIVSRALFSSQRWSPHEQGEMISKIARRVISPWDFWLVRIQWHLVLDCSKKSAYRLGDFLVSLSALVAKEKRALFYWLRCLVMLIMCGLARFACP